MQNKDLDFHQAVIEYNEEMMKFAEYLAFRIKHPVVKKWSRSVANNHRKHRDIHLKSIDFLKSSTDSESSPAPKSRPIPKPPRHVEKADVETEPEVGLKEAVETWAGSKMVEISSDENGIVIKAVSEVENVDDSAVVIESNINEGVK